MHLLDGDAALPPSLSSPRTSPWRSIVEALDGNWGGGGGAVPAEEHEHITLTMRHQAAQQKYVGMGSVFSCMEYMLDTYLQAGTAKQ